MTILGIDPGTATTGWGVISSKNRKMECLGYGVIKTLASTAAAQRLKEINSELSKLIKKYQPHVLAVEDIYFFKNLKTVIPVAQAKGVILFTAAKNRLRVHEFTPLQVKMAITGYGRAEKKQMQKMIKITLRLDELPKPDDAADALGAAVCCALGLPRTNPID
ncbi:MAG: crossover junction endodeoxyribonuclease RuvC [Patescibacteria group bacterium]